MRRFQVRPFRIRIRALAALAASAIGSLPTLATGGEPAPSVEYRPVASGYSQPIFATHAGDGSGRLFVCEQRGRIRIVGPDGPLAEDFLDLSGVVSSSGSERGLLGMAFSPTYASDGEFFVSYTRASDGASILARYSVDSADPNRADPASASVVFGPEPQPQSNHNGGMIAFGPDGFLYFALGDGGGANDEGTGHTPGLGNSQDPTNVLGSILRLDVGAPSPPLGYSIPSDNPFVGSAGGERPEIWAYGLRNPWRFSFDRGTGRLFCADVGQGSIEEIDLIVAGGNYGWRRMEGSQCFNPASGCQTGSLILPIHEYGRGDGSSVTGGYVYRGAAYPAFAGRYFFADFVSRRVWSLRESAPGQFDRDAHPAFPTNVSSFGEDEGGELYVCGYGDGTIYRIADPTAPSGADIVETLLGAAPLAPAMDRNANGAVDGADATTAFGP